MYKVAIAGAGAMGGRIGVALKQAGYNVTLIDNWKEHVYNINTYGLEVETEEAVTSVNIPAILAKDVTMKFDVIIVLTKAMESESMLEKLQEAGCIGNDTRIVSMMNGLGHEERLSKIVPLSKIYLAVTMWTAGLKGPGQLLLEGTGSIDIQRADRKKDLFTEDILKMFNDAGLNAKASDDVFKSIWSKATVNSVLNPLCTILDKNIFEFGNYEKSREMIIPIIDEIITVAAAKDIDLNRKELLEKIEATYSKATQGLHYPSMHQDYSNGRLTEIDYLNGQIVSYGESLGLTTPANKIITHLIHQLETKIR
ncbi:2-dehydropantoate 2-reductase [Staphylococcus gallinarum]|uniref:2-dehydropantoate 2-reductase n=1 Tax=Staphylococcus gallinarum TaxID=1293 RepID=A0A0D0SNV9_STAGA|nr:2-dehydropantoate 2-reductase [Staphylococcus gallinarum]KIR10904.1 2-dehydropantoate 2-reductase [Staphylococcus gallinarum]RTX75637.1 2-dehydropantoate 2-reductase [Staphylococcus gallinarum]SUQ38555.1 2-dehydropantoate 2-reductase [Staphylococcus gallinarum]SUQ38666.1 2-dehydropantoate 2-reductase [Staphylococcus gallinarum]GEQ06647.1 2-dehydropantoate 2-reductase [Staphylococcus gallinarum]